MGNREGVKLSKVGNTKPVCPYCKVSLQKMPGSKTKCRQCHNFIYIRTRPLDQQKVLLVESELEIVEEQWAIVNGTHESFLEKRREYETERKRLAALFGCEPPKNDVLWAICNKRLLEHANNGNWGLYRNTKFEMAEILRKEGRLKDSLAKYLEVFYIDINGPRNIGGWLPPRPDPFSPKDAFLAPGIFHKVSSLVEKLSLTTPELANLYQEISERNYDALKLLVPPEVAWFRLRTELNI